MSEECSYGRCAAMPNDKHEPWCRNICKNALHATLTARIKELEEALRGKAHEFRRYADDLHFGICHQIGKLTTQRRIELRDLLYEAAEIAERALKGE